MGQRLVISIKDDEKTLAACYYHWSAYSRSALEELLPVVEYFRAHPKLGDTEPLGRRHAVEAFLNDGKAGLAAEEFTNMEAMLRIGDPKIRKGKTRNDGLIVVSDAGIEEYERLADGYIDVFPASESFDFTGMVYKVWGPNENFIQGLKGSDNTIDASEYDNVLHIPSVQVMEFDEIEDLMATFNSNPLGVFYADDEPENEAYFQLIE